MLRFGIYTREQYRLAKKNGNISGAAISYKLLDIPDDATEEELQMFEDIHVSLPTSNGTCRTTCPQRFVDVDTSVMRVLKGIFGRDTQLRIQDRATSHALTSCEWAERLFQSFPSAEIEASDRLLDLLHISVTSNESYILEPSGEPLQRIKPPFVINLCRREPYRYPLNQLIAAYAKYRFEPLKLEESFAHYDKKSNGCFPLTRISCVHPKARSLRKRNARFTISMRSVFERTPGIHVLRTMNILNRCYFSEEQLSDAVLAAFQSLAAGGVWIVGRTLEEKSSNDVTVFKKKENRWEIVQRIGNGWEMEEFAKNTVSRFAVCEGK